MMRALRAPIAWVVAWLVLEQLFTVVAGHQGLLAPFGPVQVVPAVLGMVVIALRVGVTFLILPWTAWRVANFDRDRRVQGGELRRAPRTDFARL